MIIDSSSLALLGSGIALAGAVTGSAIGIAIAASAGAATLSQDRTQLRNVIILASIPMSQTFYGLIVLVIISTTVAPKLAAMSASEGSGFAVLGCTMISAFAFSVSAAWKGNVCASGISFLPKTKGRILTSAIMLVVFVELIAILGLVFTIMALSMLGLM